jgi:hypothetical protein
MQVYGAESPQLAGDGPEAAALALLMCTLQITVTLLIVVIEKEEMSWDTTHATA